MCIRMRGLVLDHAHSSTTRTSTCTTRDGFSSTHVLDDDECHRKQIAGKVRPGDPRVMPSDTKVVAVRCKYLDVDHAHRLHRAHRPVQDRVVGERGHSFGDGPRIALGGRERSPEHRRHIPLEEVGGRLGRGFGGRCER